MKLFIVFCSGELLRMGNKHLSRTVCRPSATLSTFHFSSLFWTHSRLRLQRPSTLTYKSSSTFFFSSFCATNKSIPFHPSLILPSRKRGGIRCCSNYIRMFVLHSTFKMLNFYDYFHSYRKILQDAVKFYSMSGWTHWTSKMGKN